MTERIVLRRDDTPGWQKVFNFLWKLYLDRNENDRNLALEDWLRKEGIEIKRGPNSFWTSISIDEDKLLLMILQHE